MNNEYTEKVLRACAEHDLCGDVFWKFDKDGNIAFFVGCNDFFYWGCADAEEITNENVDLFVQSAQDSGLEGGLLFCARARKLRPQGAFYDYLDREHWPMFDECGPERPADFGNPKERPDG